MLLRLGLGFALLLAFGTLLSSCADDGQAEVDLSPVTRSILLYPGARIHTVGAPPAGLKAGTRGDYKNDTLYSLFGGDPIPPEEMIAFFRQYLPEQGWQEESPMGKPTVEQFEEYCQFTFIRCASFTRGPIRLIVSSPIRFQLNPVSNNINNYHIHLETF